MRRLAEDSIVSTGRVQVLISRMKMYLASVLTGALLSGLGCGTEIIPIPIPCPPCVDTPESVSSDIELEDGRTIRTEYSPGDPNLPLIIGIHGFGGTYSDVSLIFPKGSFSTLSLSLPGSLCSDRLPNGTAHTIATCTDALEKLLEHHKGLVDQFGDRNVIIAGASFGALVVADYFARHPSSEISAVVIAGQDTPLNSGAVDLIEWYLRMVDVVFPLADNTHLQQYLASTRVFDVSQEIGYTRNRWLIIDPANDDVTPGARAMAGRLGERARFIEIPGDHFVLLAAGDDIRQIILDNLDFLLLRESDQKGAMSGWRR